MEDKKGKGISLFFYQIIDLYRTCICTSSTLAGPTHPLHYTVALDCRSETKYVCRQGRGLEISPLYHSLAAYYSQLCDGMPCLGLSLNKEEVILGPSHWRFVLGTRPKTKRRTRKKESLN